MNLRFCRSTDPSTDPATVSPDGEALPPGVYQAYAVTEISAPGTVVQSQAFGGPWILTVR